MTLEKLIENVLIKSGNERHIAKNINQYLGNICDKCHKHSEERLTIVMSFNQNKGNFRFTDLPDADYKLKRFCRKCCWSKASSAKIYIEIPDQKTYG